jgi:hypothetical protein
MINVQNREVGSSLENNVLKESPVKALPRKALNSVNHPLLSW